MTAPLSLENHDIQTCLGRIRVRTAGAGPALMFWPSLLMDGSMWLAQAAHFQQRYRVVLVDSPGHGASAALARRFSFEECALCITQILDALGIERVHFVGNSWGGMIGGTLAARHPSRVDVAVLMNATASPAGWRQRIEYRALTAMVRLLGALPGPLVGRAVRAFTGPTTERERPQVAQAIRAALQGLNVHSACWAIDSVVPGRPDQRALFAAIRTPVLVVAGAEDRTFPVAETAIMAKAIPAAEFLVMQGAAHLAGLECPAEVNAIIDAFLERHQPASDMAAGQARLLP